MNRKKYIINFVVLCFLLVFLGTVLFLKLMTSSKTVNPKDFFKHNFSTIYNKVREIILNNDKEIPGIGEKLKLPLFQLILSPEDFNHFKDIYEKYEKGSSDYYTKNNTWRKALLEYKGEIYKIKIKAHGRQPSGHAVSNFISYAIELQDGKQINKASRFSLIISERLPPFRYALIPDLAHYFNLLLQKDELIRVKINDGREKLYYFEPKFNDEYMALIGKPSFRSFCYSYSPEQTEDKTMIYTGIDNTKSEFDPEKFHKAFSEIFEKLSLPANEKESIYNRHLNLNLCIVEKKFKDIDQYFDLDYISSFEAARTLGGFQGHGFVAENFYVFYDMDSGKFYPAFHRDHFPDFLSLINNRTVEQRVNSRQPEVHTNYELRRIPLLHLFAQNDLIRQEKYKKIYQFILKEDGSFAKHQQQIVEFYEKMKFFGWLKWTLRHLGIEIAAPYDDYIGNNMKVLKSYLEESSLEVTLWSSGNQMILELLPNSMAAIRFDNLTIKIPQSFLLDDPKVYFKLVTFVSDSVSEVKEKVYPVKRSKDGIDLIDVISDLQFSTWLGEESQRVPRKYVLIFNFNIPNQLNISDKDLIMSFKNIITEKGINTNDVMIHRQEMDNSYIKILQEVTAGKDEIS